MRARAFPSLQFYFDNYVPMCFYTFEFICIFNDINVYQEKKPFFIPDFKKYKKMELTDSSEEYRNISKK